MEKLEPSIASKTDIQSLGLLTAVYVALLWLLNLGFSFDHAVSNVFFSRPCLAVDPRACWLLPKSDVSLTFWLHTVPADIFMGLGIVALLAFVASYRFRLFTPYRMLAFLTLAGVGLVPAFVAFLKAHTGHFCPSQTIDYASMTGFKHMASLKPRCYPAAHPSPGFGLMVIYFSNSPLRWRRMGLYAGLLCGGLLGLTQIARGEHFLSHVIATLMTAVFVGYWLQFLIAIYPKMIKEAIETYSLLFYNKRHKQ